MQRALMLFKRFFPDGDKEVTKMILQAFIRHLGIDNLDGMSDDQILAILTRIKSLLSTGEVIHRDGVPEKERVLMERLLEAI